MSDTKLRALERRWRDTGSPDDELAWRAEQVRAGHRFDWPAYERLAGLSTETAAQYLALRNEHGELDAGMLDLARHCRHVPAGAASERQVTDFSALVAWGEALARWGHEPLLRSLLGVGWWLAGRQDGADTHERMRRLDAACVAWLAQPTEDNLRALEHAETAVTRSTDDFREVAEYVHSGASMGVQDVHGTVEFAVEGLCQAGGLWNYEEARVAAEAAIVRWALRGAVASNDGVSAPRLVTRSRQP